MLKYLPLFFTGGLKNLGIALVIVEVDDSITSLADLRFTLYAPAETLKGDRSIDLAWTVADDEQN